MISGYSVAQIRAAEAPHRAAGEPLMDRAAAALAQEIRRLLPPQTERRPASVLMLVGSGDNGGDTLLAGAELARVHISVTVVATGDHIHSRGRATAEAAGVRFCTLGSGEVLRPDDLSQDHLAQEHLTQGDVAQLLALASTAAVVVDGILGTGTSANPALRGRARAIVEVLRPVLSAPAGPAVVAVDLPSGIGPDDGAVPNEAVLPADVTVTFGGCKAGLLREPASAYVGRLVVADIGIGAELATMTPVMRTGG